MGVESVSERLSKLQQEIKRTREKMEKDILQTIAKTEEIKRNYAVAKARHDLEWYDHHRFTREVGETIPPHLIPDSVKDREYVAYVKEERGI